MSLPVYQPQSGATKFWLILWVISGVITPAVVLAASGNLDEPSLYLWVSAIFNAVASVGLGFCRRSAGWFLLALAGGWFIMAALFLAGCNGF